MQGFRVAVLVIGWLVFGAAEGAKFAADQCESEVPLSAGDRAILLMRHLPSGVPSDGKVAVRRAYVTVYDPAHRVPRWAAWQAMREYRDTPEREGRWARFHPDPDVDNAVRHEDYTGLYDLGRGFARGHIVPYFIAGGDRDADGMDAELEDVKGWPVEDPYDACTVFEVNYMSNVAPQYHRRFNGAGGLWWVSGHSKALLPAG